MALINREDLLAAYDATHVGQPGRARELIENAEAVKAVDVEWLTDTINNTCYADKNGDWRGWALHKAAVLIYDELQKQGVI